MPKVNMPKSGDGGDLAEKGGNNDPPSRTRTRETQRLYWVFTKFPEYKDDGDLEIRESLFRNSLEKICKKYFYGHEITPSTGKLHFQGYMELTKKMRRSQIVKFAHLNMFLSPALGSEKDNEKYTTKENRKTVSWEIPKRNLFMDLNEKYKTVEEARNLFVHYISNNKTEWKIEYVQFLDKHPDEEIKRKFYIRLLTILIDDKKQYKDLLTSLRL